MNYRYTPEPQESNTSKVLKLIAFVAGCVGFAWVIVVELSK